ncbi:MAG: radical SAM protein, partial [Bacilli bacterium]|nr:radical SAM protein [Bacilli bacterium]
MKICWNLTNLCNEDCQYCFRELFERPLPLSDNLAILRKLACAGVDGITYAGGEPFIYHELKDLLIYSKSLGIKNNIITNGTILREDNLDDYLPYVEKITFSIDSPSPYVNRDIGRGKDHYEHIKRLIPIIHGRYPNIILEINSVVTRNMKDEVDYMFEAIGREKDFRSVTKWKISRFCPLRGFAKERDRLFGLTDEQFAKIKQKYDGGQANFAISVRDFDEIYDNRIVSPKGSLKISSNNE